MTRPLFFENHNPTILPTGVITLVRPINCMKLSTYQCQSSVIIGRNKKLMEVSNKNRVITILGPRLSITLPIRGPTNKPKAEKDKDMLI